MKRHTCVVCGKKRYEHFMVNVYHKSWACKYDYIFYGTPCYVHSDIQIIKNIIDLSKTLKILSIKNVI